MLQLFLFLHVIGAIAVFGPTFMFPVITSQARKSPQNFPFAATLSEYIERRIVIPGAIVQGITGLILIGILQVNPLTNSAYHWLIPGIALYLVAIVFAIMVQAKNAEKMVHLMAGMPPGPPPAGAPAGPPPEVVELGKKLQQGGMFLTVLIVLIVIFMVTKPIF
jgi:Predicted integral membrane protein (DUF2269)